ncbi:hypothetical protein O181_020412 [Austropuccinia psidii MF-1]|uniref:Uncharacterized protein n=1 Tax=Austropuccinia psidii MF-1 TaxID=1389203 RepID=A0A9Q3CBM0_9BASI|nr:hypothetical protein [Austropuccinia psidii MF-1]
MGFDFLNHFNLSIDLRQGLITFNPDYKDSIDSSISLSNKFSSANTLESLVGNSRTPSFQSSVHVTSLSPPQSLLSFKDEVFKEIKVVVKYYSVSSLTLFLGNVNLPPSSYDEFLEELWDEEKDPEEIETVMKVVPSSYHHHLDVYNQGLHFRELRERFHLAKLLFNRSTCPLCQKIMMVASICVWITKNSMLLLGRTNILLLL